MTMPIASDRILYEDQHLLIVNKLAGELVVAASGEGEGKLPLFDFLRKDYPGLRVVHRIDFGTSGIVVFARTAAAMEKIRETKFAGWQKCYSALVAGRLERKIGVIRAPLRARTHQGLVEAVTRYSVIEAFHDVSFVEACIETGRKHQIRQHFAAIHHPLILDPLYGDPKRDSAFRRQLKYRRFFLHAASLIFPHPVTNETITIKAPLPKVFLEAVQALRGERA